jgi:hypothetical protein
LAESRRGGRTAGVVDQDIHWPKAFLDLSHARVDNRQVGEIPTERKAMRAGLLDRRESFLGRGNIDIRSRDSCTFASQGFSNRPSKSPASTQYQRSFSTQP